jgi:NitT/TauT family transport system permease protein
LTKGFFDMNSLSQLLGSLWLTTKLALTGLTVSVILGTLTGILMWRFFWLEQASYPFLVALQAVPILAIAPIMTIAFGYGFMSKALVCIIISFFPIPTTLLLGMKSIDKRLIDLFRMHRASTFTTLKKLALPSALPSLFTGFRISAGLAVIGAIVGEQFFQQGDPGLGQRLSEYRVLFQYERLYAALILSSLLGICVFLAFGWLGHRLTRHWHESAS